MFLAHAVVRDAGESVDDCGGGYSESIAEMCDELQNGSIHILIQTPNGRDESGSNRDCFVLNANLKSPLHQTMFRFFGRFSLMDCNFRLLFALKQPSIDVLCMTVMVL